MKTAKLEPALNYLKHCVLKLLMVTSHDCTTCCGYQNPFVKFPPLSSVLVLSEILHLMMKHLVDFFLWLVVQDDENLKTVNLADSFSLMQPQGWHLWV